MYPVRSFRRKTRAAPGKRCARWRPTAEGSASCCNENSPRAPRRARALFEFGEATLGPRQKADFQLRERPRLRRCAARALCLAHQRASLSPGAPLGLPRRCILITSLALSLASHLTRTAAAAACPAASASSRKTASSARARAARRARLSAGGRCCPQLGGVESGGGSATAYLRERTEPKT